MNLGAVSRFMAWLRRTRQPKAVASPEPGRGVGAPAYEGIKTTPMLDDHLREKREFLRACWPGVAANS